MKNKRFIKLLKGDIYFQFKYGFYFLYIFFTILYLILLILLPQEWRKIAGSIIIYSDPAALGLFFMGAIVLLEKSQRILNALAISPVLVTEYILSKVLSICLISVIVSFILGLSAGLSNIALVLITTALSSMLFTLLGLIIGTKIKSLNQYIIASIPLEIICFLPPIIYLFRPFQILNWFVLSKPIVFIYGNYALSFYDVVSLTGILVLLFLYTHRTITNSWRMLGGTYESS